MLGSERRENKLSAIRHLDVRNVMAGGAGPPGLGPQTKSLTTFQRDAREANSLIVRIIALSGVISFEQLHHRGRARLVCDFAGHDLHHQARCRIGSELVPVLAIWSTRDAFATVSIFAECFLIDVDVGVAE